MCSVRTGTMWKFVVLIGVFISPGSRCAGQRTRQREGRSWDIRLAVPGEPGNDYPTLDNIPRTSFSCAGRTPGYYADVEANCQVFRVCTVGSTFGFQSFLCPNGTLFNQAVFVCDWWMNVNCNAAQQFMPANKDKFGNLKLGPQLMSDIKKMLTHPMRNPYEKGSTSANLIVMQDYKPPSGQLYLNSQLTHGAKRAPDTVFLPPKVGAYYKGLNDNLLAGSTPNPQYIPSINNVQSTQKDVDVFQRQRQSGQYVQQQSGQYVQGTQTGQYQAAQQPQPGNIISNGQAGRLIQAPNSAVSEQSFILGNTYNPPQPIGHVFTTPNVLNPERGQIVRQNIEYTNNALASQLNSRKQTEFGISYTKQPYNEKQEKQLYTAQTPQFSTDITGQAGHEARDNLVSNNGYAITHPTIAKAVTFNRIVQQPKPGSPKSRITFKTWIIKPSKSARLIAEPTAYTYNRPTNPPSPPPPAERLIVQPTAYYYSKPTTQAQKLISEASPYVYDKPTTVAQKIVTEEGPYKYNRPTVAAKQVLSTAATTTPSRYYLRPSAPPPTQAAKLYLPPTTFKPLARLYLPASRAPPQVTKEYVQPKISNNQERLQSAKLQASPSTPTPVIVSPPINTDNPSFSLTKHSRINTNHNNLTFTDILTKEKLDITVNDIVKDTSNILGTANPEKLGQLRQEPKSDEYSDETYLPPARGENLNKQKDTVEEAKSSRLIVKPSHDLEPPLERFNNLNENSNRLTSLPFFKEPAVPTNTIERTVSLKISIPEKTAAYLLKTGNDSDYDKLEILNTGSSNYLVLTNKLTKATPSSFIPIGKLIIDKDSNLSNSQALVFSFLQDSINQAKEYNSIAEKSVLGTTDVVSNSQFQNVNQNELAQISSQISHLTSSQYSGNSFDKDITTTAQNTGQPQSAKYTSSYPQNQSQLFQNTQPNSGTSQPNFQSGQYYSTSFQSGSPAQNANFQDTSNENQIYSGQLYQIPVPDVTGIYNGQSSAKLISPNNIRQQHTELADLQRDEEHNNIQVNNNNLGTQASGEVEIVQSQTLPLEAPARLQAAPNQQTESLNSQEDTAQNIINFLNSGNGISAKISDQIVGTLPHPLQENKLVTYKKDQSYYVFTKVENHDSIDNNHLGEQSGKLTQSSDVSGFQLIPSVSYQLDDEHEQQKILNAFNIDEFGSPKSTVNQDKNSILTSNVDYSVQHVNSGKSGQYKAPANLYSGPSSYSAPQASIGRLEDRRGRLTVPNSFASAKVEQFEDSENGYSKSSPARSFNF